MSTFLPVAFSAPVTLLPHLRYISCVSVQCPETGKALPVNALWDLGASCCVIWKSLADKLGLVPTGKCRIVTATGSVAAETATVQVQICQNTIPFEVQVSVIPDRYDGTGNEFSIGTDIISMGWLSVFPDEEGFPHFSFMYPPPKDPLIVNPQKMCEEFNHIHSSKQFSLDK